MPDKYFFILGIFYVLCISDPGSGQNWTYLGQLAGWISSTHADLNHTGLGLRYLPTLEPVFVLSAHHTLDLELSLNASYRVDMQGCDTIDTNHKIEPYRLWIRYYSEQFESRLGLQKISFGSAVFFRPLMWFDNLDPRDPLQVTRGVYALLGRYYFLTNANVWVWGLYGNEKLKGWDFYTSTDRTIEFGGRIQHPLVSGEIGASYHQRRFDYEVFNPAELTYHVNSAPEHRFGFDAKWDYTLGFWIESSFTHQVTADVPYPWQRGFTIGCDYTFGLGNGLSIITEYFSFAAGDNIFSGLEKIQFSALAGNYLLGLLDRLETIFYYDWENEQSYCFIDWQRTYDNWVFYLMVFWNPDQTRTLPALSGTSSFSGKGIQFMITFNH